MEELAKAELARYTTLRVGGVCDCLYSPSSSDELLTLLERLRSTGEPWSIVGGGSNLLISSSGVAGAVIRLTQMTSVTSPEPDVIEAACGARLPHLSRLTAERGLSGLEFAIGIPGTAGGAVLMNAGAHGSCIANILESAVIFDTREWDVKDLSAAELGFAYRKSQIDPQYQIVLSARLRLVADKAEKILEQLHRNEEYRNKTQPMNYPNGGSTFKNPSPDKTAGQLLDQAGAKQLREGNAAVSALHANFVVNMGGAISQDIIVLLRRMQDCVEKKFDIRLKPEWKKIGSFSAEELTVWMDEE